MMGPGTSEEATLLATLSEAVVRLDFDSKVILASDIYGGSVTLDASDGTEFSMTTIKQLRQPPQLDAARSRVLYLEPHADRVVGLDVNDLTKSTLALNGKVSMRIGAWQLMHDGGILLTDLFGRLVYATLPDNKASDECVTGDLCIDWES